MTSTQAQVESLAAFLTDLTESSVVAPTSMPTLAASNKADAQKCFLHQPSSPHSPAPPAAAAPGPDLPRPTGTIKLKRRNTYIVAVETEIDGAVDSLATNLLRLREQQLHFSSFNSNHNQIENGRLHQYQETMTTSNNNMSPSCVRTVLYKHRDPSARSGGGGFPPPFLPF